MPPLSKTYPGVCLVCQIPIDSAHSSSKLQESVENSLNKNLVLVFYECVSGSCPPKNLNAAPQDQKIFCAKCETMVREWHDIQVELSELNRRSREIKATLTGLMLEHDKVLNGPKLVTDFNDLRVQLTDDYGAIVVLDRLGNPERASKRRTVKDESGGSDNVGGVTDDEENNFGDGVSNAGSDVKDVSSKASSSKKTSKAKNKTGVRRRRKSRVTYDEEDDFSDNYDSRRSQARKPKRRNNLRRDSSPPKGRRSSRKKEPLCIELSSDEEAVSKRKKKREVISDDEDQVEVPVKRKAGRPKKFKVEDDDKVLKNRTKPKDRPKGKVVGAAKARLSSPGLEINGKEKEEEDETLKEDVLDEISGTFRRSPLKTKNYKETSENEDTEEPQSDAFYLNERKRAGSHGSKNSSVAPSPIKSTLPTGKPRGRPKKAAPADSNHSDSDKSASSDKPAKIPSGRPRGRPKKQKKSSDHSNDEDDADSERSPSVKPGSRKLFEELLEKNNDKMSKGSSRSEDSDAESKNVHSKRLESPGLGDANADNAVASDAEKKADSEKSEAEHSDAPNEDAGSGNSDDGRKTKESPQKRGRGRPKSKQNTPAKKPPGKPAGKPRGRPKASQPKTVQSGSEEDINESKDNDVPKGRPSRRRKLPKRIADIIELSDDDGDSVPSSRQANAGSDDDGILSAPESDVSYAKKTKKARARPGPKSKTKTAKRRGRPKASKKKRDSDESGGDDDDVVSKKNISAIRDEDEDIPCDDLPVRSNRRAGKRKKYTEDSDEFNSDASDKVVSSARKTPLTATASKGKRGRPKKKRSDDIDEVTLDSDDEKGKNENDTSDSKKPQEGEKGIQEENDREWESLDLDGLIAGLDDDEAPANKE